MIKNYMTYPLKNMRITQNYYGSTSHRKHWENSKDYKDYPIDDGGLDQGREAIYCPCDEMVVTAIKGVENSATNTVWLVSTTKVYTPTFYDICFLALTHSIDSDLKDVTVGKKYRRGEIICYEGNDGASANHIHITCGRGTSNTWVQNSNGSWVILGDTKKPEEIFYLDRSFTNEIWGGSLPWVDLPSEYVGISVPRNALENQIEIKVTNLNARSAPSLDGEKIGYVRPGIYNYEDSDVKDGYSWKKIEDFYIAYKEEWADIYPKKISLNPLEESPKEEKNNQGSGENNNTKTEEKAKEEKESVEENGKDKEEVELLEEEIKSPKLIFKCQKEGKYIIYLKENNELYLL